MYANRMLSAYICMPIKPTLNLYEILIIPYFNLEHYISRIYAQPTYIYSIDKNSPIFAILICCAIYLVYLETFFDNSKNILNQDISLTLCVIYDWKALDVRNNLILTWRLVGDFWKAQTFWDRTRLKQRLYLKVRPKILWQLIRNATSSVYLNLLRLRLRYPHLAKLKYFRKTLKLLNKFYNGCSPSA